MSPWFSLSLPVTVALALILPLSATAQTPAGKLAAVSGEVVVVRSDETRAPAVADSPLFAGDSVITGPGASAAVVLDEVDHFRIEADSEVAVDEDGADDQDKASVLRLQLGQVMAQIAKIFPDRTRPVIQTPTASFGVRGTQFEAAVALDAAAAAAVHQGLVEIKAEQAAMTLAAGQSAEVEADGSQVRPLTAFDGRDWRQRREEKLLANLPEKIPLFRDRFEKTGRRFGKLADNLLADAGRLNELMDQMVQARQADQKWEALRLQGQVRMRLPEFREMARNFRDIGGRMRAMSRLGERVAQFAAANQQRFSMEQNQQIQAHLEAIAGRKHELRQRSAQAIATLRQTFGRIKALDISRGGPGDRERPGKQRGR